MSEIRDRIIQRIEEVQKAAASKMGPELQEAEKRVTNLRLALLIHDTLASEEDEYGKNT
jgi:hypothetical protein